MPIIHFINSKSQSTGGMKNVLGYVSKEEKTQKEDKRFVTALNCSPQTCHEEFAATKNLYHKNSGRLYYHAVQSFPSGYEIDPALAHKIAVEFAEKAFGKYECVVATHIDRDHIHSHFVFNSVSFADGKKYHSDQKSVLALMKLSDEICAKYGVPILDDPDNQSPKKKNDVLTDREYRSAKKGESFKFELMNAINQAMKQAKTKRQFCWLMRQYGYGVRWEDNRKYITYTCPNGRKCRCNKLHGERYGKEMMELEFEIRRTESAVQQGTDHGSGYAAGDTGAGRKLESIDRGQPQAVSGAGQNDRDSVSGDDRERHESLSGNDAIRTDGNGQDLPKHPTGNSAGDADSSGTSPNRSRHPVQTGWEAERAIFIGAERARQLQAQAHAQNRSGGADLAGAAADPVGGLTALASIIEDRQEDEDEIPISYTDSKELEKERRIKESLGMHM